MNICRDGTTETVMKEAIGMWNGETTGIVKRSFLEVRN